MEPILTIDNLNRFGGNMLRQGDKSQLKYRLRDVGNKNLAISSKPCQVKMYGRNYTTVVYETSTTVSSDNTVSFTINKILPKGTFYLEFTVGDYIFPTDHREFFEITPSGKGMEANIIEIVGKDVLINAVKSQVDTELQPLVTSLESAEQAETQRASAESDRVSAETQRKTDHANRSAELAGKADKVVLKNEIPNGSFNNGLTGWVGRPASVKIIDNRLYNDGTNKTMVNVHYPRVVEPNTIYYYGVTAELINNTDYPLLSLGAVTSSTLAINKKGLHTYSRIAHSGEKPNGNFSLDILSVEGYFDDFMLINLTATFGAGNEPTKEQMDELINVIEHIDGGYSLNNKEMLGYLMNSIGDKANKKQEDWITPTLLNGTTEKPPSGGTENKVGYRLYDDGVVRLRGTVDATGLFLSLFTLPPGYRPTQEIKKVVSSTNDFGLVRVFINGQVIVAKGDLTEVVLDDIEFDVR